MIIFYHTFLLNYQLFLYNKLSMFFLNLTKLHTVSLANQWERSTKRYGLYIPLSPRPLSSTSSYMPSERSSCFLRDLPSVSLILYFQRSTRSPPTSLTAHFSSFQSFSPFFHHLFVRRAQASWIRFYSISQ